jgi:hypothetical protein
MHRIHLHFIAITESSCHSDYDLIGFFCLKDEKHNLKKWMFPAFKINFSVKNFGGGEFHL